MGTDVIFPDLQSAVLCEDVRCEINGMQTLVGVLSVIPAPALPINYIRLCIWTRWCSGSGKFRQKSRIVGVDEQEVIVARETKPEAPKQAAPPPEQTPSESPTPERTKPKSRGKRSTSAEPTLEQMRMAGALAAERLNNPSPSQTRRSGQSESEAAPTSTPAVPETPRPVKK